MDMIFRGFPRIASISPSKRVTEKIWKIIWNATSWATKHSLETGKMSFCWRYWVFWAPIKSLYARIPEKKTMRASVKFNHLKMHPYNHVTKLSRNTPLPSADTWFPAPWLAPFDFQHTEGSRRRRQLGAMRGDRKIWTNPIAEQLAQWFPGPQRTSDATQKKCT